MKHKVRAIGLVLASMWVWGCRDGPVSQRPSSENDSGANLQSDSETAAGDTGKRGGAKPASIPNALPNDVHRHALLIGCSKYPNLESKFQLTGPANDVPLARRLLVDRFRFPEANVVELCEAAGADRLPTRANIEREWGRLAELAGPGSQIFILMAGHGTQSPQLRADEKDAEPDGLNEVFLPRDVGPWNGAKGEIENGISDDLIREWIGRIHDKGASLWVIIDACHSGTMARSAVAEVTRQVIPAELGVSLEMLQQASENAKSRAQGPQGEVRVVAPSLREPESPSRPTDHPAAPLVALYAAQSIEPTVETMLPRSGKDRKYYGLLTYTLCEVLSEAQSPMTYRDLVVEIYRKYITWGRQGPTPMIEGTGVDHLVLDLDSLPQPPRLLIGGSRLAGWEVNAGAISGLTPGSVLSLRPPAGQSDADQVIGHARVLADGFGPIAARVEPCAYGGAPAPARLERGMRCEPVYVDFGDQRLKIGIDPATDRDEALPAAVRNALTADMRVAIGKCENLVALAAEPREVDWLLRYDSLASKELFLVPASGWPGSADDERPPMFGPAPNPRGTDFIPWLTDTLTRIARVHALLRISGGISSATATGGSSLTLDLVRSAPSADGARTVIPYGSGGVRLADGDEVGFRLENSGSGALDVTLLLIDSQYGISPLFPVGGDVNRLYRGDKIELRRTIAGQWSGLEHAVAIAVKADELSPAANFTFLAQPTLARVRSKEENEAIRSPLGTLFQSALYGAGQNKGGAVDQLSRCQIIPLSWTSVRREQP